MDKKQIAFEYRKTFFICLAVVIICTVMHYLPLSVIGVNIEASFLPALAPWLIVFATALTTLKIVYLYEPTAEVQPHA